MSARTSVSGARSSGGGGAKGAGRRNTWLAILGVVVVVATLLAYERVAELYVLATFSISALLFVVAFASFGEARVATEGVPSDDSAGIADRNASVTAAPAGTAAARRQPTGRG